MKDKKYYVLAVLSLLLLTTMGCTHKENKDDKLEEHVGYKMEYEESGDKYLFDGNEYSYKRKVTGRSNNAAKDSYYIILTNDDELTFNDVDQRLWGSDLPSDEEFVIVEYALIEE